MKRAQSIAHATVVAGVTVSPLTLRHVCFIAICLFSLIPFLGSLVSLFDLSSADNRYSHVAVIPFITAGIVLVERKRIFHFTKYGVKPAAALFVFGILVHLTATRWAPSLGGQAGLAVPILLVVLSWIGSFLLCYGPRALKAAAFPALFLLLAVPIPGPLVDRLSFALQAGSADLSHALFRLFGVPVFRKGDVFSLPGLTIQVAEECSGIRSTTALIISSILVGYVFLRLGWTRLALVLVTTFVAVFKNAARIVFLSAMEVYFDAGFLHGVLHHRYGGTVFSFMALAMIAPVFFALRKCERPQTAPAGVSRGAEGSQPLGQF